MNRLDMDVVCFSHLRWNFVFQRPQHLMSRCAERSRVYFIEEPLFDAERLELKHTICPHTGVHVITPCLPPAPGDVTAKQRQLLKDFFREERITDFVAWYYTPMAIEFTDDLIPKLTIYDCMDELSAFANAPVHMLRNEHRLFTRSDLIFTGGLSLYEAKCLHHEQVYLFPSSVDTAHFSRALAGLEDPPDQKTIPHPRIGYAGVIDERMDLSLMSYLADNRPEWHIVLLGPVVKIKPSDLPVRSNVHSLGMKQYEQLPSYLSAWDVALLPFAENDATRFISPTKTPEYLAAGLPVVSTPIRDVDRLYGRLGLVTIGRDPESFLKGIERQLSVGRSPQWQSQVKDFLSDLSWDKTWSEMERLILRGLSRKRRAKSKMAATSALRPQASAARV